MAEEMLFRRQVRVSSCVGDVIAHDQVNHRVWVRLGWVPLSEVELLSDAEQNEEDA